MVRNYKRPFGARNYADYSEETLNAAVEAVRTGKMSGRKASQHFGVPRGTIQNKIQGRGKENNSGRTSPTVLSNEGEEMIANHVIVTSNYAFPLTMFDIRCVVKAYLDKEKRNVTKFKNNMPGKDWALSFVRRNTALTVRMAGKIKRLRAKITPGILEDYFDKLECTLEDIPPSNIFNYDETNLSDDPGNKRVVTQRGCKYPERVMNATKSAHSVMFCVSATGEMLPVYVVYKSEHLWRTWVEGGPDGARYNRTKSGWFDSACFVDWFEFTCLPYLKILPGKRALCGDNLGSHFSPRVIQLCIDNDIVFFCLPPNSTHITQPLDISLFRPLKAEWRKILTDWKEKSGKDSPLSKDVFPKLLRKLVIKMQENKSSIVSGFRKAGIFPLDKNQVLSRLPKNVLHGDDQGESVALNVSSSLLEFLSKERYGDPEKTQKRKRTKITVQPGKSVCLEDLSAPDVNQAAKGKTQRKKKVPVVVSESEDEQSVDDVSEVEQYDHETEEDFGYEIDSYVIVEYEGEYFPGKVMNVDIDGSAEVSAMVMRGLDWGWPERVDQVWYAKEKIVEVIAVPKAKPASGKMPRGQVFTVPEIQKFRKF